MQTKFTENGWIKIAIVIALTSLGLTYLITTNGGRINICVDNNNFSVEIESSLQSEFTEESELAEKLLLTKRQNYIK